MAIFTGTNLLFSSIALTIAYYIYHDLTIGRRHRALITRNGCQPPPAGNKRPWFFGLDNLFDTFDAYKKHTLLERRSKRLIENNAHTISITFMGRKIYMTDDPEIIKIMLATRFEEWSLGQERIKDMSSYLGLGIFTSEGAAWKHSREMLRPCFERSQVADVSIMEKHTSRLIDLVPKDGSTVDLQHYFHELTLDVATEFLFGQSTNSLDHSRVSEYVQEFVEAFEYCQAPFESENVAKYGLFLAMFLPDSKKKRCAKIVSAFADRIIDEEIAAREKAPTEKSRYVFLDELLSLTQDRTIIRSELLNILLAGRDTTASLLSNVFFELPKHPEMMARLRREITEHVGDDIPTYAQLKDMKFLKAVLSEAQRLYPIVPSNSRQAVKDVILPRGGGPDGTAPVFIPKDTYMMFHSFSMHRRADIYGDDAEVFDPTRWLDGEHKSSPLRPGWGYIPFSGGPRICIGQNFALTEAMFVIVRLLQHFEVEGREEGPWMEKLSLTCVSMSSKVGLHPRVL